MSPNRADSPASPDDGESALVEVAERGDGARLPLCDRLGEMVRLLDRDRREPRQGLAVGTVQAGDVPDHGDLRVAGYAQVRGDLNPARPVRARAGRAGNARR